MKNQHIMKTHLPKPVDDGETSHLQRIIFPEASLLSTNDNLVNTTDFKKGITVVYCYPLTGRPDQEPPKDWEQIPGAKGCTTQTLSFREKYDKFKKRNVRLFGLSTQTTEYQKEMVKRLDVPFPILSDSDLKLTKLLNLPTFEVEGKILLKRLTMIVEDGVIVKVFYPVFPPSENAEEVLAWIELNNQEEVH